LQSGFGFILVAFFFERDVIAPLYGDIKLRGILGDEEAQAH
jgi:hypothetical protein